MQNPFGYPCGMFFLPDNLLDDILAANSEEEQEQVFLNYLHDIAVSSPYELYGLVWHRHEYLPIDVQALTLDYIVSAKGSWDPDHVACFLLEVAEDLTRFVDISSWLIEVDLPEMLELSRAQIMIWEMFWQGHDHLIMELINHYQWHRSLARQLDDHPESIDSRKDAEDYYSYYALARVIESGKSREPIYDSEPLAEGLLATEERRFYDAISILLEFYGKFPNVTPHKFCTALATCYLETGWRGSALEWVMQALKDDPDNLESQNLQAQILSVDREQLQRLMVELRRQFYSLAQESLEALALAEFLYRYHGRKLHDYAPIISGYARAVEIQLLQRLLPNVRRWIQEHGVEGTEGRRRVQAGQRNLYADCPDHNVTLDVWSKLFSSEHPQRDRHTPGRFYYCIHKVYGSGIELDPLNQFGSLLGELKELRNRASHRTVNNWDKVHRTRQILFDAGLFDLLHSAKGTMFVLEYNEGLMLGA